jgi:anti-sigma factor RsiW
MMRCSDVPGALDGDKGDLSAVRRHLEVCAECARRYAEDLEVEEALRGLYTEVAPVDLTADVREALRVLNTNRARYDLIRRWMWIGVSAAIVAILVFSMPALTSWMNTAYKAVEALDASRLIYCNALPASSVRTVHVLLPMVAALAWFAVYLWREARTASR